MHCNTARVKTKRTDNAHRLLNLVFGKGKKRNPSLNECKIDSSMMTISDSGNLSPDDEERRSWLESGQSVPGRERERERKRCLLASWNPVPLDQKQDKTRAGRYPCLHRVDGWMRSSVPIRILWKKEKKGQVLMYPCLVLVEQAWEMYT